MELKADIEDQNIDEGQKSKEEFEDTSTVETVQNTWQHC